MISPNKAFTASTEPAASHAAAWRAEAAKEPGLPCAGGAGAIEGAGADKKGRGAATVVLDASLNSLGGSTRVDLAIDLTISGAAAQYGRGLVADFTEVLIDQTANSMKTRMTAIAEGRDPMAVGAPQAASGFSIAFSAFTLAVKRVFARFFLPYQPAPSRS